jgi:hypothetical protein
LAQGGGFDDARVEPVMARAAPARHMAEVEAEPRRHNSEEAGEGEHGAATGNPNLAPPPRHLLDNLRPARIWCSGGTVLRD